MRAVVDETEILTEAVDKIAWIGGRLSAVRTKFKTSLGSLEEGGIQEHCEVCYGSREVVSVFCSWMAIDFQEEAKTMLVRVDKAVYKAVRDLTSHIQFVQEGVTSKLSEATEIVVSVAVDDCEAPVFEVCEMLEEICVLDEPIAQTSLPARMVDVTIDEC